MELFRFCSPDLTTARSDIQWSRQKRDPPPLPPAHVKFALVTR